MYFVVLLTLAGVSPRLPLVPRRSCLGTRVVGVSHALLLPSRFLCPYLTLTTLIWFFHPQAIRCGSLVLPDRTVHDPYR